MKPRRNISGPSVATIRRDQVEDVLRLVMPHMGWKRKKAIVWLKTPNPLLGGVTPSDMIVRGRGEKLLRWVRAIIEGNTP